VDGIARIAGVPFELTEQARREIGITPSLQGWVVMIELFEDEAIASGVNE
jgi:hypothetical protein